MPDRTPPPPPGTGPNDAGTTVVEAATAEAAVAEVHRQLGADARILDARKVLRGGIAGFFSRELVQLCAAPAQPRVSTAGSSAAPRRTGVGVPAEFATAEERAARRRAAVEAARRPTRLPRRSVARVTVPNLGLDGDRTTHHARPTPSHDGATSASRSAGTATSAFASDPPTLDDDPVDFSAFLTHQLSTTADHPVPSLPETDSPRAGGGMAAPHDTVSSDADPSSTPGAPAPGPATTPAPSTHAEAPRDDHDWSHTALLRLGLPGELVRGLDIPPPGDDLAWTSALARAVLPLCRPLPTGPCVLAGPRAPDVASELGLPAARGSRFLRALEDGRWIHVVVGDDWREVLLHDPLAVSWTIASDLPEALRCSVELGLILGYGWFDGTYRRARAMDVAMAVRALVGACGRSLR